MNARQIHKLRKIQGHAGTSLTLLENKEYGEIKQHLVWMITHVHLILQELKI